METSDDKTKKVNRQETADLKMLSNRQYYIVEMIFYHSKFYSTSNIVGRYFVLLTVAVARTCLIILLSLLDLKLE